MERRSAMKSQDRVTWFLITVKDYYAVSIIRMRRVEVEGFEWVGGLELVS